LTSIGSRIADFLNTTLTKWLLQEFSCESRFVPVSLRHYNGILVASTNDLPAQALQVSRFYKLEYNNDLIGKGYIGGDILYALEKAHPEYEYTALVRNSDSAAPVAAQYPKIRFAYGSFDDSNIIEEEASKADFVIRMDFHPFDLELVVDKA
jgi:hypothetical protein